MQNNPSTLKSPVNSIMTYRIWEKFCHHHLTYTSPGSPEYWPTCRNIQKVRQVRKFAPCLHEHCTVWCELAILSMTRIQWRKIKLTLFMKTFRTPSLLNTFCLWKMFLWKHHETYVKRFQNNPISRPLKKLFLTFLYKKGVLSCETTGRPIYNKYVFPKDLKMQWW